MKHESKVPFFAIFHEFSTFENEKPTVKFNLTCLLSNRNLSTYLPCNHFKDLSHVLCGEYTDVFVKSVFCYSMLPPSFYIQKYFSKGVIFRAC